MLLLLINKLGSLNVLLRLSCYIHCLKESTVFLVYVVTEQRYVPPALRGRPEAQQRVSRMREDDEPPSNVRQQGCISWDGLAANVCAGFDYWFAFQSRNRRRRSRTQRSAKPGKLLNRRTTPWRHHNTHRNLPQGIPRLPAQQTEMLIRNGEIWWRYKNSFIGVRIFTDGRA